MSKIAKFFRESRSEYKKVVWQPRKELFAHTVLVLTVIVIASTVIGCVDWGFGKILMALLGM